MITGDVTGNLTGDVTGTVSTLNNFAVQDVSFANLFLSNDASFNGNLAVGGTITGDVTGNVNGDLTGDVTGTVSSLNNFAVQDVSFASLYLSNDASFNGMLGVGGDCSVSGVLHATDASFNGAVKVINGGLQIVGGDLLYVGTGSDSLAIGTVLGGTKFGVDVNSGNTDVKGTLTVVDDASFNGQLFAKNMDATTIGVNYAVKLHNATGKLEKDTSSSRYKTDIVDMPRELGDMTYSLRPRIYKRPDGDREEIGLIAEEVDEVGLKHVVVYDAEGRPDALAYDRLVAPLIQVVKDQRERIDALEARVAALEQPR